MPSFEEFDEAFERELEGRKYNIVLGRSDSDAAEGTSIGSDDSVA
jgi:hypothetical protein